MEHTNVIENFCYMKNIAERFIFILNIKVKNII